MAFDFNKLNFFNRLNARSRVVVLLAGVVAFIFIVYLGTKYLGGGAKTLGPSHVANVPAGTQSIPGGQITSPLYQRTLLEQNKQRAEAAKMTGASAIPTTMNTGMSFNTGGCVICEEQNANVKNLLDDMQRKGLAADVANDLEALADKNVTPEEFAAALDNLVKSGKLTPEQARQLLEEYKKQHTNALVKDSAKTMDDLIKSGQLPLDVANQLLNDQKNKMSVGDYAAELQKLVSQGKISPEVAQALLAQYSKQCLQQASTQNIAFIEQMSGNGAITQAVAKMLEDLTKHDAPIDQYVGALSSFVSQGKLTPDASGKLSDAYRQGKVACGAVSALDTMIKQAENAAYQEISDLQAAGKITPEVAAQLTSMIQNNASLDDYKAALNQLLVQKKITPEIAQLKLGDYAKVKQLRDEQQRLAALQAKNALPIVPVTGGGAAAGQFAALQQKVAAGAVPPPIATAAIPEGAQFAAVQAQALQESEQARETRLAALEQTMLGQATSLINSWQAPEMRHTGGTGEGSGPKERFGKEKGKESTVEVTTSTSTGAGTGETLIKGGTIIFAVLDTTVNSDYIDSPVLATVVEGKFKGAKLLGKLVTAKSVSGQMDRISLNFIKMNFDPWPKSRTITAYAIDPDTAKTVLASEVNYHYMQKFGAIMATSFLQGYASGITNAGSSTTGIFGTSTTHPQLSPANKLMVGLGQVGQTLGNVTQNYVNIPPTVKVDSGVSLGILFMDDVT